MPIQCTDEGDHIFFFEPGAPERSTGWIDGWRVEIDYGQFECIVKQIEFFDAEKNELYPCSLLSGSDLCDEVGYFLEEAFGETA